MSKIIIEKIVLKYVEIDYDYDNMMYVGKSTRANVDEAVSFPSMKQAKLHANFVYMKAVPKTIRVTFEEIE